MYEHKESVRTEGIFPRQCQNKYGREIKHSDVQISDFTDIGSVDDWMFFLDDWMFFLDDWMFFLDDSLLVYHAVEVSI